MGLRIFAAAGVSLFSTITFAGVPLQTIALTGTTGGLGPQLGGSQTFSTFSAPRLNSAGTVAFSGRLTPTAHDGIWLRDTGALRPIALTDTDGPLGPGQGLGVAYQLFNLGNPALNNAGAITFSASTNRTPQYQGIWQNLGAANDDIAIVRTDGPLGPHLGAGVAFIANISSAVPLNDGRVVFRGNVDTNDGVNGGQEGVWQIGPGGPMPIARVNTVLNGLGPNQPDGSTFSTFEQLITTRAGEILVDGRLQNPGGAALVRLSSVDPNTAIARTGTDQMLGPQLGAGVSFSDFSQTRATGDFSYATTALLQGAGVDDSNDQGVFKVAAKLTGDWVVPVARSGTDGALGPNMGAGVVFAEPPFSALGNPVFPIVTGHNETLAFSGCVAGGAFTAAANKGLWIGDETGVTPLAITNVSGEFGPELSDANLVFKSFGAMALNDDESFFFTANVATLAAPTGQGGLWAYVDGDTMPLVQVGDTFAPDPANPGILKTVSFVDANWSSDPVTRRAAVVLQFTDGTRGVFTAPIPEPASIASLVGLSAIALGHRRRRGGRLRRRR